jgi:hypothetical protein
LACIDPLNTILVIVRRKLARVCVSISSFVRTKKSGSNETAAGRARRTVVKKFILRAMMRISH